MYIIARLFLWSFLTGSLIIAGCKTSSTNANSSNDRVEILNQLKLFQQAVKQKDTALLQTLYSEKAVSLRQNEAARKSMPLIIQRWNSAFKGPFVLSVTSDELVVTSKQSAYQYGTFEVNSTDTPSQLLATGKWAFVWGKENKQWKIDLEMDNFNARNSK